MTPIEVQTEEFALALFELMATIEHADRSLLEDNIADAYRRLKSALPRLREKAE